HPRDSNPPGADVDEHQEVNGDLAEAGPDVLREKVARPEGVHVAPDEPVPVALATPRRRMKAVLDQYLFDRVCGNRDAELPELALDAPIAPTGFLGQLQDQFLYVLRNPWAARRPGGFHAGRLPAFPHPPQEGFVMHDGEQLLDAVAQRCAE